MKATFIKKNILCTLSKAEISYLNYLLRIYDKTGHERNEYTIKIMKDNNYFYKKNKDVYQVLKIEEV
jgi:hypothetical protein